MTANGREREESSDKFCRHNPVCHSMYNHDMLLVADSFIITMENMAMEALNKNKNFNHASTILTKPTKQNAKMAEKHRQKDTRSRMPQNLQRQRQKK